MEQIIGNTGVGVKINPEIQDDFVEISDDSVEDDDPFHVDNDKNQQSGEVVAQVQKHKEIDWSKVYRTPSTGDCTSRQITKPHKGKSKTSQCPYCPFKTRHIKSHILSCHTAESNIKWFRCNQCEYKGKLKQSLTKHIFRRHTDPNQVIDTMKKCEECPKMFKESGDLKRHILQVHKKSDTKKEIKCSQCEYKCVSSLQLRHHQDICHVDSETETLQCPECSYKTKVRWYLKQHMTRHGDAKYQCEQCAWRTHTFNKLRLHLIHHKEVKDEGDFNFHCDKCPYKTYRYHSFSVHKLKHLTPEETQYFYCYHCDFKAKRKDNLKTHVLRHFKSNEVALACYICDFTTFKNHLLVSHIEKHSKKMSN